MAGPPFSARNRGNHHQVDNAFPQSARNGLTHLLIDLVEKEYVANWIVVARELQRIGRLPPIEYDRTKTPSLRQAREDAETALGALGWERIYDACGFPLRLFH